jgi:hypothetical protein
LPICQLFSPLLFCLFSWSLFDWKKLTQRSRKWPTSTNVQKDIRTCHHCHPLLLYHPLLLLFNNRSSPKQRVHRRFQLRSILPLPLAPLLFPLFHEPLQSLIGAPLIPHFRVNLLPQLCPSRRPRRQQDVVLILARPIHQSNTIWLFELHFFFCHDISMRMLWRFFIFEFSVLLMNHGFTSIRWCASPVQ